MFVTFVFRSQSTSSLVSARMGERLLTFVSVKSRTRRFGIPATTEMLSISLYETSRYSSCVQAASAEMSVTPAPTSSRRVTSLVKVCPPSVISSTLSMGSSVRMVQPGSSLCSASSSSSVISRPRMSSVARPSRP